MSILAQPGERQPEHLRHQYEHEQRADHVDRERNHVPLAFLRYPLLDRTVRQQRVDDVLPIEAVARHHVDERQPDRKHGHVLEQELDRVGQPGREQARLGDEARHVHGAGRIARMADVHTRHHQIDLHHTAGRGCARIATTCPARCDYLRRLAVKVCLQGRHDNHHDGKRHQHQTEVDARIEAAVEYFRILCAPFHDGAVQGRGVPLKA
uniref:Uncharacterized protein n=1 Tax=Anopheles coluzzii TaxID=1518534 RepID=A0A8W7PI31_ANOCL